MNNLYMYTEGLLNTLFGLVTRIMPNRYIYNTKVCADAFKMHTNKYYKHIFIYFFPNKGK